MRRFESVIKYKTTEELSPRTKVAAFDMDYTLIHPKSGLKFPKDKNDWEWHFKNVPLKLNKLYEDGYDIVIFSNQNGIKKGKQKEEDIIDKIKLMSQELKIPLTAYLSTDKDYYRKPSTSMWDLHITYILPYVDLENSFYVGDAAGRIKGWDGNKKTKKDFSCSDRKFAKNCGIKFYTEQMFFLNKTGTTNWEWKSLNPNTYNFDNQLQDIDLTCDVVIMVGCPASGKSTFSKKYIDNYTIINRDKLKTMSKCQKYMEQALLNGKKVIIDNTNPDKISRNVWIKISKKYNKSVECCVMNTKREVAKHMNLYREKISEGKIKRIPDIAYNIFFKKFELPIKAEGIDKIHSVKFVPKFKSKFHKNKFMEFTE